MKKYKAVRAKLKNKGLHFFFYLTSIMVMVVVGVSMWTKVTMDLYQQDLASAYRLSRLNDLTRLPLTGTPDNQFLLMILIISFAIVATLAIMLKLNRAGISKPNKKTKQVKKK